MQSPTPLQSELGRTVRELRTSRGLTARELALRLGVSPATVSAVENGRTGLSATRTARLAELLGVPIQRMFFPRNDGSGPDRVPRAVAPPASPLSDGVDPGTVPGAPGAGWRVFAPLTLDAALRGALSCFLEFGYHGATMRTIAERADLSVSGIYHYYPSKQDMLVAVLDLTMADLHARSVAARDEGRDAVERFALLVECYALFHTHRRELGFVGASEMRSLAPGARHRLAAMRREQQRMVDREVALGVRAGAFLTTRPFEAARAVVTTCTALPQWFRQDGSDTPEQVAEQYVEFALDLVRFVGTATAGTVHAPPDTTPGPGGVLPSTIAT